MPGPILYLHIRPVSGTGPRRCPIIEPSGTPSTVRIIIICTVVAGDVAPRALHDACLVVVGEAEALGGVEGGA